MDDLQEGDYSFSTWIRLEDPLPPALPNVLHGRGFQMVPNDSYFNNIESLMALTPTGSRIMSKGPGQGFYINGDAAFHSRRNWHNERRQLHEFVRRYVQGTRNR